MEKSWQPQDFLPDPSSNGFHEEVQELTERAKKIPNDYFVCLVGDMITEEALLTYQTMLNTLDGVQDETGARLTSWAIWTRAWTADENKHGDLLNKYLYLSGRVDMRQIEKTIQYLIGSGMGDRDCMTSHQLVDFIHEYINAAEVANGKLYVMGGSHNGRYLFDIQVFDFGTLTWSVVKPNRDSSKDTEAVNSLEGAMPACAGHSMVYWDSKPFIVAGDSKEHSDRVTEHPSDHEMLEIVTSR